MVHITSKYNGNYKHNCNTVINYYCYHVLRNFLNVLNLSYLMYSYWKYFKMFSPLMFLCALTNTLTFCPIFYYQFHRHMPVCIAKPARLPNTILPGRFRRGGDYNIWRGGGVNHPRNTEIIVVNNCQKCGF